MRPIMIDSFINKCKNPFYLFEEINKIFDKQISIFVETNEKLTNWYIHNNENFINYTINSLLEYNNDNFSSWNINTNYGISLKKKENNWPNLELSLFNNREVSLYYSKTETIILYLLNNDLKLPEFIIDNIKKHGVIIQNILVHELTHYYDDMMLKGKGILLKNKTKNNKKYYNSFNEINAYTKQTIDLMIKYLTLVINSILDNSNLTLEEEFNHILHELLNKVISSNDGIKSFFNNLNEKNKKHVYKEIGLYFKKYFSDNYFLLNLIARDNYDLERHNEYWKNKSN